MSTQKKLVEAVGVMTDQQAAEFVRAAWIYVGSFEPPAGLIGAVEVLSAHGLASEDVYQDTAAGQGLSV